MMNPRIKYFVLMVFVSFQLSLKAAMPVIDFRAIYTELVNARRDLVQQVGQLEAQRQQVLQLTSQIKQVDDYLERFGTPSEIEIEVFEDLYELVQDFPSTKSSKELSRLLSVDILFKKQDVYDPISRNIEVDGEIVAVRNTDDFKPDLVARQGFEEYHQLKDRALEKRKKIDADIQSALKQLEKASTASEVQKLAVTISSLNAQRAELSKEIELAASDAMSRYLQNEAEEKIAGIARQQERRETMKVGMRKAVTQFEFPTGPTLFRP